MGAKTNQRNHLLLLVNPNQQEIILDVALHATGIIPGKLMGFMLRFNRPGLLKLSQNPFQRRQLGCIVLVVFQILLELGRVGQFPHSTEQLQTHQTSPDPALPCSRRSLLRGWPQWFLRSAHRIRHPSGQSLHSC